MPYNSLQLTEACGADQKWLWDARAAWPTSRRSPRLGLPAAAGLRGSSILRLIRPLNRRLKKLHEEMQRLRQAYPQAKVELWSSDEHRIGLKPILRRVWGKRGCKVTTVVKQHYQWMYLYGFVQPESGRTFWLLIPTVNVEAFELALAAFAREQQLGADKHLLLVLDQAGWHTRSRLRLPEGLHLHFLPPHSPELQSAERLWPLSNKSLANRIFASLDELEQAQAERCRWLQAHPEVIRGRTSYHWWPSSLDPT